MARNTQDYIKKYISGNIVLATIVVLISNFTQPLVKLRLPFYDKMAVEGDTAPTYLLLQLGKRGSKWGDFHWAMGCV